MASTKIRIGINMAGAVSAGAYTAGVLDFLMEALEQWQAAKDTFREYLAHPAPGPVPPVAPLHDAVIEVFSGASAGGMCAAIASVMVQQPFQHILTGDEQNTTNTFYESWVNKIDIHELLKIDDVTDGKPLLSLLDCTIIDQIADYALTPSQPTPRPYIDPSLTLFLTLTNTRGIPYQLYDDPSPTTEEFTAYYADRLQFETTVGSTPPLDSRAKPLPAGQPEQGAWDLLKLAAKATGAVPVALASRVIPRNAADYRIPNWASLCGPSVPLAPSFPAGTTTLQTVVVDGGVTDNSPFALADQHLASHGPAANLCENPSAADVVDAIVLTVAPFPMEDKFDPAYDPTRHQNIWSIIGSSFSVLISQSRFLGEDLAGIMRGTSYSRFVIAPSDPDCAQDQALQCSTMGAFGGFISRDFRKHDFLLGRRNCQQFLRHHFSLPVSNPIVAAGLAEAGSYAASIKALFGVKPPSLQAATQYGEEWMPIVPLCGTATAEVPGPVRTLIPAAVVDPIVDLIVSRLNAIRSQLAPGKLGGIVSSALGFLLNTWIVKGKVKDAIKDALLNGLKPNIQQS